MKGVNSSGNLSTTFFESYFSNYIEGTVFEVDEAKNIIESNKPLPGRNEDSHDVLGTYREVHPFLDGNGRIARIMMNTDL